MLVYWVSYEKVDVIVGNIRCTEHVAQSSLYTYDELLLMGSGVVLKPSGMNLQSINADNTL